MQVLWKTGVYSEKNSVNNNSNDYKLNATAVCDAPLSLCQIDITPDSDNQLDL